MELLGGLTSDAGGAGELSAGEQLLARRIADLDIPAHLLVHFIERRAKYGSGSVFPWRFKGPGHLL